MDTYQQIQAELYHWGHFDVLRDAAEQFASNGKVKYDDILTKTRHYLLDILHNIPLHQDIGDGIKEWWENRLEPIHEPCRDWDELFLAKKEEPEEDVKQKQYLLPLKHFCKLAADAYDIDCNGMLSWHGEEDNVRFARFGCVPPLLLGAARYAMKPGLKWNGKNIIVTAEQARQEFNVLLQRGLADTHVHLVAAAQYTDLFYAAVRGITPPNISRRGADYIENGNTYDKWNFSGNHLQLAMRPLLLACKAMLAYILYCKEKGRKFGTFLDESLSRKFWRSMYLAAAKPQPIHQNNFECLVGTVLNQCGNYQTLLKRNVPFESLWYDIVRFVLENRNEDKHLVEHWTQLTRCICCLYRPLYHREGFYEFNKLFRYLDIFIDASGNPDGRLPKRIPKDKPIDRLRIDSMQQRCKYLERLQLRTTVSATKKRKPRRPLSRRKNHEPLIADIGLAVELGRLLATYQKYFDEHTKRLCPHCGKEIKATSNEAREQLTLCPNCNKALKQEPPIFITFPIHLIRDSKDKAQMRSEQPLPRERLQKRRWYFGLLWHRIDVLTRLFIKIPSLRYFFGRIDVANNEDKVPNWVFALLFHELDERLKNIKTGGNVSLPFPAMRYNCHAGEHFSSSIQGLRRIWEPVHYFPTIHAIGHAFALGIPNRFPSTMPADELLDDLVWILLHREHIPGIPLEHIERFAEKIAEEIYGKETKKGKNDGIQEMLFRDLKDAYRWRFKRDKVAKYIGILKWDKAKKDYEYVPRFELPKDTDKETLPKAAKILQRYFTNEECDKPYLLDSEIRNILAQCFPPLRDFVKRELIKKNIVAECCPASNYRIGHLGSLTEHPVFTMNPPDKSGGVATVLGTDDPTMFQSSIDEEYLTVFQAMQRKYPDISLDKQLDYLEDIRKRSWELCNGDLPQNENKLRQIPEESVKGIENLTSDLRFH